MGFINKVIDTAVNAVELGKKKLDEMEKKELQKQRDFINNPSYNNIYYIKCIGLEDNGFWLEPAKTYQVLNNKGVCEYIIKEKAFSDGRKYKFLDNNGNEIGTAEKHRINISCFGEEDNKSCSIYIKNEGGFGLETYYYNNKFDNYDKGNKIRMTGSSLSIEKNEDNYKIYTVKDKISWSKSAEVFSIYRIYLKGIVDAKYIIRFHNPEYKLKAIFTAFRLELV